MVNDQIRAAETTSEFKDVWCSEDGKTWDRVLAHAPWAPRTHFSVTVYNDRMYIIGGSVHCQSNSSNEVWRSPDGIVWENFANSGFPPRHVSSVAVHDGRLWLIAGYLVNDVWTYRI